MYQILLILLQHETFHQREKKVDQNQPYTLIIQIKSPMCSLFSFIFKRSL